MISIPLEKESKDIIDDIHAFNELFFDQIKFPYVEIEDEIPFSPSMLAEAYSDEETEYTTKDLIWKNPNYDPSR
ncbi:hypothetical protein EHQ43_09925 [Leptospira bouyouniensis]|uniref:Uncharacterized protein n=1 Tax=Leptospira bouyouniensis TaxID=2484911 RepID=A0A7I0HT54_9LEPT|nr:hypothetical protein [Leptospira bouyouniensis]TGL06705.1 hypothetical protein EHQ43_09925 [Leptospira bouyouniensis]